MIILEAIRVHPEHRRDAIAVEIGAGMMNVERGERRNRQRHRLCHPSPHGVILAVCVPFARVLLGAGRSRGGRRTMPGRYSVAAARGRLPPECANSPTIPSDRGTTFSVRSDDEVDHGNVANALAVVHEAATEKDVTLQDRGALICRVAS